MDTPGDALLTIQNLHLEITRLGHTVSVLNGVNLHLRQGEIVGLVGETGSGKTLTAMSILRLLPPGARLTQGRILLDGADVVTAPSSRVQHLRGRTIGVIFQQPRASLNPTRPVVQQVADRFVDLLDLSRAEAMDRSLDLLGRVGLPQPSVRGNQYPHQLSGGMCQRVMVAAAIAAGPQLLLADEPTTGLDVTLQAQILDLLTGLAQQNQMAVLLITHDLAMVAQACRRVLVMYAGEVVEEGSTEAVLRSPRHPYTQGLVQAIASLEAGQRPQAIPGVVPRFQAPPRSCPFATRCPHVFDRCRQERPVLRPISAAPPHHVACHLAAEGSDACST